MPGLKNELPMQNRSHKFGRRAVVAGAGAQQKSITEHLFVVSTEHCNGLENVCSKTDLGRPAKEFREKTKPKVPEAGLEPARP